ncbi:hypothetical protein LSH36_37g08042 [Paralvinella palmiformis]|uniref:CBM21 domain-containing protein n=1 Tax=Paralvinella palmiformis TaxID=53620 RepID=A0AAD9K7Y6_9ANNE|nr:hypothetical protein LSH36_37g08042 [Paralvinella palmiformis]
MQCRRVDDLTSASNVLAHFTKNASYTENYHEKYYYTQLVRKRIAARKLRENERQRELVREAEAESGLYAANNPDSPAEERRSGSVPLPTSSAPAQVSSGTCRWYLSTGEPAARLAPRTQLASSAGNEHRDRLRASGRGRSDPDASVRSPSSSSATTSSPSSEMADGDELVANWERVERSSSAGISSESVTSEDSVFSEDYTAMAEPLGEPADNSGSHHDHRLECEQQTTRRRTPLDGSEDVDSSFSSPGSSTSTLEADGNEDGGDVEDSVKDKVIDGSGVVGSDRCSSRRCGAGSSSPPLSRKTRPNIRLLLGQPAPDIDDSPSPPPANANRAEDEGERSTYSERPDVGDDGGAGGVAVASGSRMKKSESNSFYEDREFDFLKAEPVRRSTSLKTYKTPPGTPHRKKAVRFADALGLDLESVRHILNLEEPPEVPKSAMRDLVIGLEEENRTDGVKYLSALFSQPGVDPNFLRRVQEGKVVLENCIVDDKDMTISGTVRVANVAYHKCVIVRYTTNGWLSSEDIVASYVQNSNDGPTDRFSFTVNVPKYFAVGQRLELAFMYTAGGSTFWDNNFGKNYAVECYARAMPISESDNTWMHFL